MKMFTIDAAIESWRSELIASEGISKEAVAELELHLLDSVCDLESKGLTQEEAFLIAGRRLGNCDSLDREFSSVSPVTVWKRRVFWMLLGYVGLSTLLAVVGIVGYSGAMGAAVLAPKETVPAVSVVSYGLTVILFVVTAILSWRYLLRDSLSRIGAAFGRHPFKASFAAFLLLVSPKILWIVSSMVSIRILSLEEMGALAMHLSVSNIATQTIAILSICCSLAYLGKLLFVARSS
ncbi:MAG: hypothetical protein ACI9R3_002179 [Verrucomicrobiales bacterium]|jgi:hypothetical protein